MGFGCTKLQSERPEVIYYDYTGNLVGYPATAQYHPANHHVTLPRSGVFDDYGAMEQLASQHPNFMIPSFYGISGVEAGMFAFDPVAYETELSQHKSDAGFHSADENVGGSQYFPGGFGSFYGGGNTYNTQQSQGHPQARSNVFVYPHESSICRVVATFSYFARHQDELNIRQGLVMDVYGNPYGNWLRVRTFEKPSRVGFVPSSYVALADSLEAQSWYFGYVPRSDAERLLLCRSNIDGSFLVRSGNFQNANYALSVRVADQVKHFLIHGTTETGFSVTDDRKYPSLLQLVAQHVSKHMKPIPRLSMPCFKIEAPPTIGLTHQLEHEWEVPRHLLRFTKKLGEGNFGEVHLALFAEVLKVAVKTLKQTKMSTKEFMEEVAVMQRLLHPKVVQLYGISTTDDPFFIVTEFMSKGDLLSFLRKGDGQYLPEAKLIDLAVQVANGMAYLEANNFVHRDLAARNVLVGDENICKISDFGFARLSQEGSSFTETGQKLPVKWCAPECMKDKVFSSRSDVWAFGIVLCEIIELGMTPYPGMHAGEAAKKVCKGYVMPQDVMENCPDKLYNIMKKCWKFQPKNRPTFFQLVNTLEAFYDESEEPKNKKKAKNIRKSKGKKK